MRGRRTRHGHDRGATALTATAAGQAEPDEHPTAHTGTEHPAGQAEPDEHPTAHTGTEHPATSPPVQFREGPTGLALRWLESESGRGFRALRHSPFRRLYSGFVVQHLGFWTAHVSLQSLVDTATDSDTAAMSLLFAALLGPMLPISPLAGVLADRRDRRRLMIRAYSAMGLVSAAFALLTTMKPDPPLAAVYALSGLFGTAFAVTPPVIGACVADSVDRSDLQSAISLQAAAANITRVGGPVLAAALIAASTSYGIAFATFSATCVFAAAMLGRTQLRPYQPDYANASVLGRLRDGLRHAKDRPPALHALRTAAVTSLFGVSQMALIPAFTSKELGGEQGQFAWVVASTGVGAIAGALLLGYSKRSVTLAGGASAQLGYGIALIAFALSNHLAMGVAAQAVAGFFYFWSMTQLQTLIQSLADDAKRARLMSLFNLAWGGIVWIGALLLGLAARPSALDLRPTMLTAAVICAAHGAWTKATARA